MRNNRRPDIPEIPNWLIIMFLFTAPPVGVVLIIVKRLLPRLITFLMSTDDPFARRNRYSGYEKKDGDTVFTDFRDMGTAASREEPKKKESAPVPEKPGKIPYKTSSLVLLIIGAVFLFAAAVGLTELAPELAGHGLAGLRTDEFGAFITTFILGGSCASVGAALRGKYKLIKKYVAVIGERGWVKLTDIAGSLNRTLKKVTKDLERVIDSGVYGEYAYIDVGRQMFLRNPAFAPPEEKPAADTASEETDDPGEYGQILRKIRRLDEEIKDEAVSRRIVQMEEYTRRIFECVEKDPARAKDVRTFMTYYLPTTLKLLETYSEIERVGVAGDNMRSAKESIEQTLDLLVEGYKRLLDKLYASDSMDISSDIDVLEKMMEKDGLKGGTFGQN